MKTHLALFACLIILVGSIVTKTSNSSNPSASFKSGGIQSLPSNEVTFEKKSVEPDSLVEASKKALHKETKSLIRATFDCIKSVCTE